MKIYYHTNCGDIKVSQSTYFEIQQLADAKKCLSAGTYDVLAYLFNKGSVYITDYVDDAPDLRGTDG